MTDEELSAAVRDSDIGALLRAHAEQLRANKTFIAKFGTVPGNLDRVEKTVEDLKERQDEDDRRNVFNTVLFRLGAPLLALGVSAAVSVGGYALARSETVALNRQNIEAHAARLSTIEERAVTESERVRDLEQTTARTEEQIESLKHTIEQQTSAMQSLVESMPRHGRRR